MRKLIGLDMDGVMNPSDFDSEKVSKTAVYYLNRVLEACPDADILITSCWGNTNNYTTNALVEKGFKYPERIIDYTDTNGTHKNRTAEVDYWMINNKSDVYDDIICIDDDVQEFEYFGDYYGATKYGIVLCDGNIGFNITQAYELICKLNGHNLRYWG